MREIAQFEADEAAVRLRPGYGAGPSVVYSVRLDPAELAALRAQADAAGLRPTVLARNLIRCGLSAPGGASLADAVGRLEDAVARLRSTLPEGRVAS